MPSLSLLYKYSWLVSLNKELGTFPARPLLLRARNCKLGRVAQSGRMAPVEKVLTPKCR